MSTIENHKHAVWLHVIPAEGSVRSQKLLGSVSTSLVQRWLSTGLFRVPQISSGQVGFALHVDKNDAHVYCLKLQYVLSHLKPASMSSYTKI